MAILVVCIFAGRENEMNLRALMPAGSAIDTLDIKKERKIGREES